MSKFGLTRVTYEGDRCVVIAGSVSEAVLEGAVKVEPVASPGRPLRVVRKPDAPAATVESLTQPAVDAVRKESQMPGNPMTVVTNDARAAKFTGLSRHEMQEA